MSNRRGLSEARKTERATFSAAVGSRAMANKMISADASPVARNLIWQEHVKKELRHQTATPYTINPHTMHFVADKPQNITGQLEKARAMKQPRSLSSGTSSPFKDAAARQFATTGLASLPATMTPISCVLGSTSMPAASSTASLSSSTSFSSPVPSSTGITSPASTRRTSQELKSSGFLASSANLTAVISPMMAAHDRDPKQKFIFPVTSNHEYGWNSTPLMPPNKTAPFDYALPTCDVTQYASAYVLSQGHNMYSSRPAAAGSSSTTGRL